MYTQMEEESNWHWREPAQERENGTSTINKKTRRHHPLVIRVFNVLGSVRVTDVHQLLRLRWPYVSKRLPRGKLYVTLDVDRLPSFLDVTPECISRLRSPFCPPVISAESLHKRKIPIDCASLPQTYRRMLADGGFLTQTELARHWGASRVWGSRILKVIIPIGGKDR
jgi:hypothetical protein